MDVQNAPLDSNLVPNLRRIWDIYALITLSKSPISRYTTILWLPTSKGHDM